jgi:hypothetical protein
MGQAKRSSTDNVVKVDPKLRRPPNAEESVPEALVPDVVHTNLHQSEADSGAEARTAAPDRWQRIQRRAYEIAQERGFTPGAELSDWLQAEREVDGQGDGQMDGQMDGQSAGGARQASPEDQFTG